MPQGGLTPGRRVVCRSVGRRPEVWPPYAGGGLNGYEI